MDTSLEQLDATIPVNKSQEVLDLLAECYASMEKFCKVFLPDNFYAPFSDLHRQMLEKIDRRVEKKKLVICAPRGIGKTSLARAIAGKAILYADAKFIVYVSSSATNAEMQTENLKKDLMGEDIKRCFGDIRTRRADFGSDNWSKKTWIASTANGEHYTLVLPRGSGQQVRGLVWRDPNGHNVRPDLIIVDDLEDTDTIENEEQRKKRKVWFFGDLMKCFSRIESNWSVIYIDTLKHSDALIQNLIEASDWDSLTLSICDDNYRSLAPEFISDEEILKEVEIHREQGAMDIFAREFMCMPISKEDAVFRPEYFKYYSEADQEFQKLVREMVTVVIVDPAKSANMSSCETGFVVWSVHLGLHRLYLRYASGDRLHPDDLFDKAISLCIRYKTRILGIETTGTKEFITYPLINELVKRGLGIEVIELHARKGVGEFAGTGGGKKMRISSLVSYYRTGSVYHEKSCANVFESQLLAFPRGKRQDVIDAGAYITEMLDVGGRFFIPTDDDLKTAEEVEREYAEMYEETLAELDDWRISP